MISLSLGRVQGPHNPLVTNSGMFTVSPVPSFLNGFKISKKGMLVISPQTVGFEPHSKGKTAAGAT